MIEASRDRLDEMGSLDSGHPEFMMVMGSNYRQMRQVLAAALNLCDQSRIVDVGHDWVDVRQVITVDDVVRVVAEKLGVTP